MSRILDQHGNPIDSAVLKEPQTARIAALQNQYLIPMLSGLTPARLAHTLREADQGNLIEQHRLFSDMEERDAHLSSEMQKRKGAIVGLSWSIVPPRDASPAEKADAEWVSEMLQDGVDPIEDMLQAMMDAVGHGFGPVELEWQQVGSSLLPAFHPRPQEWFRLNSARTALTLTDGTLDGAPLQPFGWVMHANGKPKTGYGARMGLHRTLVWPFLYKAYALGDFAEFLETYGLPFIVGKYHAGATSDEKASLMRAVTALGHDARAIMPAEMTLEIQKIAGGGGDGGHMAMMGWADKAESKVILGQTLSADTGDKGGGSFALGKVHNEVRHDIMRSDARQVGATLTRDLVFPMITLNRNGAATMDRCPRFVLDVGEPEDLTAYADALPKLVAVGFKIPQSWAQEKLHIPMAKADEPVLSVAPASAVPALAALSSVVPGAAARVPAALPNPLVKESEQLAGAAAPIWSDLVGRVKTMVDNASDLTTLQRDMVASFGGEAPDELVKLMAAAFALAELKGLSDIKDGA